MNNFNQQEFVNFMLRFACNHGDGTEQGQAFALVQKYQAPEAALVVPAAPMRPAVLQGIAQELNALVMFGGATPPVVVDSLFGAPLVQAQALMAKLLAEVFPGT